MKFIPTELPKVIPKKMEGRYTTRAAATTLTQVLDDANRAIDGLENVIDKIYDPYLAIKPKTPIVIDGIIFPLIMIYINRETKTTFITPRKNPLTQEAKHYITLLFETKEKSPLSSHSPAGVCYDDICVVAVQGFGKIFRFQRKENGIKHFVEDWEPGYEHRFIRAGIETYIIAASEYR